MLARTLGLVREQRAQATAWGYWPGDVVPSNASSITPATSLQLLAVYGCTRMIADGISTLPIDTYRELPDGTRQEIPKPGWLLQPTVDLSWIDWCGQMITSLLLAGNAFAAVTRSDRQSISELVPLDPTHIKVVRENGVPAYYGAHGRFIGEMLHIKGLMWPGAVEGMSPVEAARQTIGIGMAAADYGTRYFDTDGNMPGVIELPGKAQPEQITGLSQQWRRLRAKGGKGLPGVLDGGATWKPTGVTNEQMQFLETRRFTDAQIASQMFLIDPSDIGISERGSSLTYQNLAERNTRRVQTVYLPWIIRIEKAISALMSNPRYMKIEVGGLMRGSTKERWEVFQLASQINTAAAASGDQPVMLTEEMRALEDLEPLDVPAAPVPEVPAAGVTV